MPQDQFSLGLRRRRVYWGWDVEAITDFYRLLSFSIPLIITVINAYFVDSVLNTDKYEEENKYNL